MAHLLLRSSLPGIAFRYSTHTLSDSILSSVITTRGPAGSRFRVIFTTAESSPSAAPREEGTQSPSYEDQIALIRSALSLQIKELAEAVGVKRPTVYSWINDENSPQATNRDRLHAIYRLAQQWSRLSSSPLGKALHDVDEQGISVFDFLRKPTISSASIIGRFRTLVTAQQAQPRTASTSVRELARQHDIDLSRVADRQDDIDIETGKPFSTD